MTSEGKTTARERRVRLKAALSRALTGILYQRDVTQQELAAAAGARTTIAQRWCDRERAETISVADAVGIAEAHPMVARDLLEWIASRIGYELRPAGQAAEGDGIAVIHEALDAIRAITATQADGVIEPHEAREELRELAELEEAIATRRARLRGVVATYERGLS